MSNSRLIMLNNPSVQKRHSMEADGWVFNNWSVIQTATLKLVITFSCHGEYQTGLCLCVREKHKSHSPAIKATRLETRECAGCIFLLLSPLCSLLTLCYVFSHFSHFNFFLLTTCLRGKMDSSHCCSGIRLQVGFFCVTVSSSRSIISTH